jgi:hypothetical protein
MLISKAMIETTTSNSTNVNPLHRSLRLQRMTVSPAREMSRTPDVQDSGRSAVPPRNGGEYGGPL